VKVSVGDLIYPDSAHLKQALGVCLVIDICKTKKMWHRKLELLSLSTGRTVIVPWLHLRDSVKVISKAKENE